MAGAAGPSYHVTKHLWPTPPVLQKKKEYLAHAIDLWQRYCSGVVILYWDCERTSWMPPAVMRGIVLTLPVACRCGRRSYLQRWRQEMPLK